MKSKMLLRISGMTCGSCEILLERKLRSIPGVLHAHVQHKKGTALITLDEANPPDLDNLESVIRAAGYRLKGDTDHTAAEVSEYSGRTNPTLMEIGAALLIIFALYKVFQVFDLAALAPSTSGVLTGGGVFLIGLVAGSSSCLAVTGGLLLAMAAKHNQIHRAETTWQKLRPLMQFNAGRLVSYTVLGGVVGLIGKSITLSPQITAYMNIAVALVMLYIALTILGIIKQGSLPIRPPKAVSHWIANLSENEHPLAPMLLGGLTFFLPCGFTQSLQLAALASGSFGAGALIMGIFALGTLPSLLGISFIASAAKGSFSRIFLTFSGTLVLVLAIFNLRSGLALAGITITLPSSSSPSIQNQIPPSPVANGVQEIRMEVTPYGYDPENLTIRAGVPVRWIVDGTNATGCTRGIVIPSLGIQRILNLGPNVIEFTAANPGTLAFSCTMGMVRGSFTVL